MSWGALIRLCLVNAAIGGLAALPLNLFNRLMTVELAFPALIPGLLVALHYGVQLTRPVWGHRSDARGGRRPFILAGIATVGLGILGAALGISVAETSRGAALLIWALSYCAIGLGIGAAGTSFLALLASVSGDRKGAAATLAWLLLIAGAIIASIGTGIALAPYSPERLIAVVACVSGIAFLLCVFATQGIEDKADAQTERNEQPFFEALQQTWADPVARAFSGFVFLSILAFHLSELIFEPFAGHIHGLTPEDSTKLSGGKDGAALIGMIGAGVLAHLKFGSLRLWAITGCVLSAAGLLALATQLPLLPATVLLGFGNGLFVVGAIGAMMQLAAAREKETGTRIGVFGAAQAVAAGLAGLVATSALDLARLTMSDGMAYGLVFSIEAVLFLGAAAVAARVIRPTREIATLVPGE